MSVPYIPGPEAVLGPALDKIGKAINEIVEPNFQFNLQFRQHLAANPELLQQLADAEHLSPGSLANIMGPNKKPLIPPDVMNAIHSMSPSKEALGREGMQHYLGGLSQADRDRILASRALGVNAAQLERETPVARGIQQVSATEPGTVREAGRRELTGGAGAGNIAESELTADTVHYANQYLQTLTPEQRTSLGFDRMFPNVYQRQHDALVMAQQEKLLDMRLDERRDELAQRSQDRALQWRMHEDALNRGRDDALGNQLAREAGYGTPEKWALFIHNQLPTTDPEYSEYAAHRDAMHEAGISGKLLANSTFVTRLEQQVTQGVRGEGGSFEDLTPQQKNSNIRLINNALTESDVLQNIRTQRAIVINGKLTHVPADVYDAAVKIRQGVQGYTLDNLNRSTVSPLFKSKVQQLLTQMGERNSYMGI